MRIKFSARTDAGKVRKLNEDNYLIVPQMLNGEKFFEETTDYKLNQDFSLILVADGMGGASAGEVAAKIAVDTVYDVLKKQSDLENRNWFEMFHQAFNEVNKKLQGYSEENPDSKGLGTTCVAAVLYQGYAFISWIGDSRAYLWNESSELQKLSKDHSLVQELIDNDLITEEQAFDHPNKNVITQSLDDSGSKLKPGNIKVELTNKDYLLLCSDGLSGMVMDKAINGIFKDVKDNQSELMNTLTQAALDGGGLDNITLVSARVDDLKVGAIAAKVDKPESNYSPANGSIIRWLYTILLVIFIGIVSVIGIRHFGEINDRLIVYEENGLYGYKDGNEEVVIGARYDVAGAFSEGRARVFVWDSVYYIDQSGNIIEIIRPAKVGTIEDEISADEKLDSLDDESRNNQSDGQKYTPSINPELERMTDEPETSQEESNKEGEARIIPDTISIEEAMEKKLEPEVIENTESSLPTIDTSSILDLRNDTLNQSDH